MSKRDEIERGNKIERNDAWKRNRKQQGNEIKNEIERQRTIKSKEKKLEAGEQCSYIELQTRIVEARLWQMVA